MADFPGTPGNDTFNATAGPDTFNGGDGFDIVLFDSEGGPNGVTVDLGALRATDSTGANDILNSIEGVGGTQGADDLRGSASANTFYGFAGNDTINGQDGVDAVNYALDESRGGLGGVDVNLASGTARDGFGSTDTLSFIEQVVGTNFNDVLVGDGLRNTLIGGGGDDFIDGGDDVDVLVGGDGNDVIIATENVRGIGDTIRPGSGINTVTATAVIVPGSGRRDGHDITFSDIQSSVVVDLQGGTASAAGMSTTFTEVNFAQGSGFNDVLNGGEQTEINQVFAGHAGDDIIDGGGGFDEVRYDAEVRNGYINGAGATVLGAQAIAVDLTQGFGIDSFGNVDTLRNIEAVRGTQFNDVFVGREDGVSVFVGFAGNDLIVGNGGFTIVDYSRDADFGAPGAAGVIVNLTDGGAIDGFGTVDTLVGIQDVRGTNNADLIIGDDGRNGLSGRDGIDRIDGRGGSDNIDGGGDYDVALFRSLDGAGFEIFRVGGTVYTVDVIDRSTDTIRNVEQFEGAGGTLLFGQVQEFDPFAYVASYDDLLERFGDGDFGQISDNGISSFRFGGFFNGRETTFDAGQYLANYGDLRAAFGGDEGIATIHFIKSGFGEGRLAEDPLDYIASYGDLIGAFRGNDQATLTAIGLAHFQGAGQAEGRREGIDFDPVQYLSNYADLRGLFGNPVGEDGGAAGDAAAAHFINTGFGEGRLAEDPLAYVASYADLIEQFGGLGSPAAIAAAGLEHYEQTGFAQNRGATIDFNVDNYLANYADLRAVFADGTGGYDEAAATLHFITNGFNENRTDDLLTA